jgi:chromosome partitioning protein
MIVTIATYAPDAAADLVAENLALLRARSGRKVLLMDATSRQACRQWVTERERLHLGPRIEARAVRGFGLSQELERLYPHFGDVVIDTDGGNGHECRAALIMAQIAVVPLAPDQADAGIHYDLIARLNNARMFNPGLRVLFVTAGSEHDPAPGELRAIRNYVAQVMAGGLASTILHSPALLWGGNRPGLCASDIESSTGTAEMAALYEEVFQTACCQQ